jgi:hypothetical protein
MRTLKRYSALVFALVAAIAASVAHVAYTHPSGISQLPGSEGELARTAPMMETLVVFFTVLHRFSNFCGRRFGVLGPREELIIGACEGARHFELVSSAAVLVVRAGGCILHFRWTIIDCLMMAVAAWIFTTCILSIIADNRRLKAESDGAK